MAIFISTTYFGDGSSVQKAVNELIGAGITKIELGSNHGSISTKDPLVLPNGGLGREYVVHNYFPPQESDFILNIASRYPQIREKSIEFFKNSVNWCYRRKIRYYTIHPGFFAEAIAPVSHKGVNRNFDLKFKKSSLRRNRKKIIEETIKIIKGLYLFADGKLQLLIENQGSKTSKGATLFDSLEEIQLLKQSIGDKLKFNFNLAHATLSGINVQDKKVFYYIHKISPFFEASEIRGIYDSHLPLQLGDGRILKLFQKYRELFKKRDVILEYRNIEREKLLKSFDFINKLLSTN